MIFELIGAAGLPQAIKLVGALGAAGIDLVNKLGRTDNCQLRRLRGRTAAGIYARRNSPTDWWCLSNQQLTELVQILCQAQSSGPRRACRLCRWPYRDGSAIHRTYKDVYPPPRIRCARQTTR